MNWGYKILAVYLLFVAGIVFLVIKSSAQNQDLVTKDYYEQELKFQDKIDETERANALSASVKYNISNDTLNIQFPPEMNGVSLKADILLYCVADKSKDIQLEASSSNAFIQMPLNKSSKGLFEIKINWMANTASYYYQHKIMIQ